jgi:hypothetical protein
MELQLPLAIHILQKFEFQKVLEFLEILYIYNVEIMEVCFGFFLELRLYVLEVTKEEGSKRGKIWVRKSNNISQYKNQKIIK